MGSKIAGNSFDFPITETCRVFAASPANLARFGCSLFFRLGFAKCSFLQCLFGYGRIGTLDICVHDGISGNQLKQGTILTMIVSFANPGKV